MNDSALRMMSKRLQDEIAYLEDDMGKGNAVDFGAYKYACGIIRGYRLANGYIAEIVEQANRGDDE